jgi:serine/threonine-protein kinase
MMRVILEVTQGPQEGERFVFDRNEAFVVGRKKNERVQFRIPDDRYFSRYHMIIEVRPPDCFVRDIGSRNGTWVNGQQVREARLQDGDVLKGGRTEMRVRIEATPPAAEPPLGERPAEGLCCRLCKDPLPDEAFLHGLTDPRLLCYVCEPCCHDHRDPRCPVPNYEKLAVLGEGRFGPVLKARRISTGILVALKLASPEASANAAAVRQFLREMLWSAKLDHPRIVPIVEMGQAGRDLWIASEFIDGPDAEKLAGRHGGRLPAGDAVEIVCQALEGLEYAHGLNLVHREVKPSNLLVCGRPGAYEARLCDFGVMRNMDEAGMSNITQGREARGTVYFMPPEQVADCRYVRAAGDLYGAGATLYWLLTGHYARDFEALDRRGERKDPYLVVLDEPVIPLRRRDPALPEALARAVETSLANDPEDRYPSAAAMAEALRRAI